MKGSLSNLPIENERLQIIDSIGQQSASMEAESRQLTCDALVLDAQLRQSLAAVRSLGSRGLRVAALGISKWAPAFSSRWCQQAFICPADVGTEEYFHYLDRLLERFHVGVLIPSSDATVALIRRHREQLEQRVRIALAKEPALAIAVSKERTLEVARRLGVCVPHTISVGKVSEVEVALREVGLPAVVKPVESWAWNDQQGMRLDVQLVTTTAEAERAVEELTSFGGTTLFQEFIPGRRESVSILYAHGEIYACYAQRHYRVSGGQSTLRQSIAVPKDIGDQVERLIREIDLEGCSEAEFRRDNAGNAYLMEINPRLWASTELGMRSGVDFPYLLYQWSTGDKIDMVKSYRVGVWMRHLRGDITVTSKALQQRGRPGVISPTRAILGFCFSFFFPMRYDYVDWKDPLPIWSAIAGSTYEVLERVKSSLRRRKHQ